MNRIIKFRAWTDNLKDGGKMYYQEVSPEYHLWFSPAGYGLMNPSLKIMQFTGLTDKNGKEIWEGDMLKYKDKHNLTDDIECGVVVFQDGTFGINDGWDIFHDFGLFTGVPGCDGMKTIKVIGNIYENPELLKE